jgi:anti-anti-sigma factor
MKETASLSPARMDSSGGVVAVVYAGDYVNKMSGQRIERECRTRLEEGCRALVIDFKNTELVNSIGVSILLGIVDIAESRDARLVFSNLNRHNQKLFELLGLTRYVALADSEEAALTLLGEFSTLPPQGH